MVTETKSAVTSRDATKPLIRIVVDRAYRRFRSLGNDLMSIQTTDLLWQQLTDDERQRLGGDFKTAYHNHESAIGFWIALQNVSKVLAVLQASVFLELISPRQKEWLCRALNIEDNSISTRLGASDPKSAIEHAINTSDLVIIESPRVIYWRRNRIEMNWNRNGSMWEFMVEISLRAKRGRDLRYDDVRESTDVNALSKMASRLRRTDGFPSELADHLSPNGTGSYVLSLPHHQIRGFRQNANGVLEEWR